jgi:hypothetical protein
MTTLPPQVLSPPRPSPNLLPFTAPCPPLHYGLELLDASTATLPRSAHTLSNRPPLPLPSHSVVAPSLAAWIRPSRRRQWHGWLARRWRRRGGIHASADRRSDRRRGWDGSGGEGAREVGRLVGGGGGGSEARRRDGDGEPGRGVAEVAGRGDEAGREAGKVGVGGRVSLEGMGHVGIIEGRGRHEVCGGRGEQTQSEDGVNRLLFLPHLGTRCAVYLLTWPHPRRRRWACC